MKTQYVRSLLSADSLTAFAESGLTIQETADRIGCSRSTLEQHARRKAVKFVHGNKRPRNLPVEGSLRPDMLASLNRLLDDRLETELAHGLEIEFGFRQVAA